MFNISTVLAFGFVSQTKRNYSKRKWLFLWTCNWNLMFYFYGAVGWVSIVGCIRVSCRLHCGLIPG